VREDGLEELARGLYEENSIENTFYREKFHREHILQRTRERGLYSEHSADNTLSRERYIENTFYSCLGEQGLGEIERGLTALYTEHIL
jgi:hypothetical protein